MSKLRSCAIPLLHIFSVAFHLKNKVHSFTTAHFLSVALTEIKNRREIGHFEHLKVRLNSGLAQYHVPPIPSPPLPSPLNDPVTCTKATICYPARACAARGKVISRGGVHKK